MPVSLGRSPSQKTNGPLSEAIVEGDGSRAMQPGRLGWAGLGALARSTNRQGMNAIHHGLLVPRTGDTFVGSGMSLLLSIMNKLIEPDLAPEHG